MAADGRSDLRPARRYAMKNPDNRRFPVLWPWRDEERKTCDALGCPRDISWALVETHDLQARKNHAQSLTRLAERAGLDPCELVAVLEDRPFRSIPLGDAVRRLLELVGGGP